MPFSINIDCFIFNENHCSDAMIYENTFNPLMPGGNKKVTHT